MIFLVAPTDFKLQFLTVLLAEIYQFSSFSTRYVSKFDLKKENGHQRIFYDSPLSYGGPLRLDLVQLGVSYCEKKKRKYGFIRLENFNPLLFQYALITVAFSIAIIWLVPTLFGYLLYLET